MACPWSVLRIGRLGRVGRRRRSLIGGVPVPLVQVNESESRWLLKGKLIVFDRLIDGQLHDDQAYVILFLRPLDIDETGKLHTVIFLVKLIAGMGNGIAVVIEDDLPVGH